MFPFVSSGEINTTVTSMFNNNADPCVLRQPGNSGPWTAEENLRTQRKSRVFKCVSHRVTSVPSDFHGGLGQDGRDQGLDRLLYDFSESGFFYVRRL